MWLLMERSEYRCALSKCARLRCFLAATVAAAASLANERVPGVDRSGSLSRAGPNGERDQEGTHVSQGRVAKAPDEVVSACVPVCIAGTLAA